MNEKTGRDPLFPDARGEASAHVSPTESYLVDIPFSFGSAVFHLLKLSRGWVTRQDFSHSHGSRNYEIHYIPAGKGEAFIEHTSYAVTPNTLYVTGPHIEHSQSCAPQDPILEYCAHFEVEYKTPPEMSEDCALARFLKQDFWFGQDTQHILALFQDMFQELSLKKIGCQECIQALLGQFIVSLVRNYVSEAPAVPPRPAPAAVPRPIHSPAPISPPALNPVQKDGELAAHKTITAEYYFLYEYTHLSLEELSDRLGFSPRQTQRFLKEHFGKTFNEKKRESRMAAALLLLSSSEESITSISAKLGFSSAEYFSSSFKQYYHLSPLEYRRCLTHHPADPDDV